MFDGPEYGTCVVRTIAATKANEYCCKVFVVDEGFVLVPRVGVWY